MSEVIFNFKPIFYETIKREKYMNIINIRVKCLIPLKYARTLKIIYDSKVFFIQIFLESVHQRLYLTMKYTQRVISASEVYEKCHICSWSMYKRSYLTINIFIVKGKCDPHAYYLRGIYGAKNTSGKYDSLYIIKGQYDP